MKILPKKKNLFNLTIHFNQNKIRMDRPNADYEKTIPFYMFSD